MTQQLPQTNSKNRFKKPVLFLNQISPMKNLILAERQFIERSIKHQIDVKYIAQALKVSPSTVYREIKRNSTKKGYSATHAQKLYLARKKFVGGATKRKRVFKIRRKKPYLLFADRRRIKWQSDDRSVWKYYLKRSKIHQHRTSFYKLRILLEKSYHFKNDYLLFKLLTQHIKNKRITERKIIVPKKVINIKYMGSIEKQTFHRAG